MYEFKSCRLSDGKEYTLVELSSNYDYISCTAKYWKRIHYVETIEDCYDEDWKTAVAQEKPKIPKGTKLRVYDIYHTLYGVVVVVKYSGFNYYIYPEYFKYVGSKEVESDNIRY